MTERMVSVRSPMYEAQSTIMNSLRQQITRLEVLARHIEESRRRLPHSTDDVWRGPASTLYGSALHGLARELVAAAVQIDRALGNSRCALATIAARG